MGFFNIARTGGTKDERKMNDMYIHAANSKCFGTPPSTVDVSG
jgi:hypothetical protein